MNWAGKDWTKNQDLFIHFTFPVDHSPVCTGIKHARHLAETVKVSRDSLLDIDIINTKERTAESQYFLITVMFLS